MSPVTLRLKDEHETEALGGRLATALGRLKLVTLDGPLGAGKTTLVRGLLRALGHAGAAKSPTFTLVEPYTFNGQRLYHFDFYRLKSPEELEFLGLRDYLADDALCLIEWAERAHGWLPPADVAITILPDDHGRQATLVAHTDTGEQWLGGF